MVGQFNIEPANSVIERSRILVAPLVPQGLSPLVCTRHGVPTPVPRSLLVAWPCPVHPNVKLPMQKPISSVVLQLIPFSVCGQFASGKLHDPLA